VWRYEYGRAPTRSLEGHYSSVGVCVCVRRRTMEHEEYGKSKVCRVRTSAVEYGRSRKVQQT
jgi:hypothetical protein